MKKESFCLPATSAFLPASIDPEGPPTSGNPMVLTIASILTAFELSYDSSRTICPLLTLSISDLDVKRSRTIVCASTPLINIGIYVMK